MNPTPRTSTFARPTRHAPVVHGEGSVSSAHRPDSPRAGDAAPRLVRSIDATLVWLDDAPLATDATWLVELGARTVRAHFAAIARADGFAATGTAVTKNALIRARLTLHETLAVDEPASSSASITFVVVDAATHRAVAAGTVDA